MFDGNFLAEAIVMYVCLLLSLSVHEAAHAAISNYCGDPSARLMGRVSLNPLAHIDPIGTVLMPMLMIFTQVPFLFGWAKPVPFNPRNLKDQRRDPALIALAGPTSNLLLAFLVVFIARVLALFVETGAITALPYLAVVFIIKMILINLVLAAFNLIPVPPLDGHHLLYYFMPASGQRALEQIGPFGILIAILVARPLFSFLMPLFSFILGFAGIDALAQAAGMI